MAVLGRLGAILGHLGAILGHLGAVLRRLGALFVFLEQTVDSVSTDGNRFATSGAPCGAGGARPLHANPASKTPRKAACLPRKSMARHRCRAR